MLLTNSLQKKIQDGNVVFGTWNTLASPLVTEALARSGLDFVIIDFEHGPFQLDQTHVYVDKCEAHGCSPIVRVPRNSDWMVLQALDQGAHGVIVPHIDTAEDAARLAKATKYYPHGDRGFTPFTKAGGFTNQRAKEYSQLANEKILTGIIIESAEGLRNLDQILKVDGIDIVYFGAYDLSRDLGCPGQVWSEKVVAAIQEGLEKVRAAGKCPGGFVPQNRDQMRQLIEMKMQFITYEVDSSIIFTAVQGMLNWARQGDWV